MFLSSQANDADVGLGLFVGMLWYAGHLAKKELQQMASSQNHDQADQPTLQAQKHDEEKNAAPSLVMDVEIIGSKV